MGNMNYCRFQNTINDMNDCLEYLIEGGIPNSAEEIKAMRNMRECCHDLIAYLTDTLEIIDKS